MGIELRMPSINGNEREQLVQIRSYLYQLVSQLQWALNNVNVTESSGAVGQATPKVIASAPAASINPQITFDKLKPLIIDSAEIVAAYYEEINKKLKGLYVAESDFGTYIQQTEVKINQTATATTDNYENYQVILTDLEGVKSSIGDINTESTRLSEDIDGLKGDISDDIEDLKAALAEVKGKADELNGWVLSTKAHIRTGEIDKRVDADGNEFPVYGVEIGQVDTVNGQEVLRKFARFSSGKLSFYDQNNTEVAYISDYKLYITNAEVTGTLKLGGFLIDTSKGLTIKWVGRG